MDDDSELNLQEIEKTMSLAGVSAFPLNMCSALELSFLVVSWYYAVILSAQHYDSDGKDDDEPMLDLNDAKSAVLSKVPMAHSFTCYGIVLGSGALIAFHDVAFLPSLPLKFVLPPHILKIVVEVKASGPPHVL